MSIENSLIDPDERILVTGAAGFIGVRVVKRLLDQGFNNIRCFGRPSGAIGTIRSIASHHEKANIDVVQGNLLSRNDCAEAVKDVAVVIHLAAGRGEKSFPDAFANSVVTTRNLVEASGRSGFLKRFVSISSFTVYSNRDKPWWRRLDESCSVELRPELRGDAYCFAKVKQDELVQEYAKRLGIPCVIVRPGYVFGPGNEQITGRVGIDTFGIFLHLGGSNTIPFTYVDNCADAVIAAGLTKGVDGEVFNIVDDDLPTSRQFLRLYKKNVKRFRSIYLPHVLSYALCSLWERYARWSKGQLPPAFNRGRWHVDWKKTDYTNEKAKVRLGWKPRVSMGEGLDRYFESCRKRVGNG